MAAVLAISNLEAARAQMAVSLGFHIVFASLGIGLPVLMLISEYRTNRTGDEVWMALARRWAKGFGILFAIGAVSGTMLSFALGLFWPGLMGRWGAVIGLPFALEAFAFFLEAIFLGIYLYGWDRLSPWAHWWSGVPVAISGAASAWFVVTANAWMQTPTGFRLRGGTLVDRPLLCVDSALLSLGQRAPELQGIEVRERSGREPPPGRRRSGPAGPG